MRLDDLGPPGKEMRRETGRSDRARKRACLDRPVEWGEPGRARRRTPRRNEKFHRKDVGRGSSGAEIAGAAHRERRVGTMPFAANRNGARAPGPGTYRALFRSASSHRLPAIILDHSSLAVVVRMHQAPWTGSVEAKPRVPALSGREVLQGLAGGSHGAMTTVIPAIRAGKPAARARSGGSRPAPFVRSSAGSSSGAPTAGAHARRDASGTGATRSRARGDRSRGASGRGEDRR